MDWFEAYCWEALRKPHTDWDSSRWKLSPSRLIRICNSAQHTSSVKSTSFSENSRQKSYNQRQKEAQQKAQTSRELLDLRRLGLTLLSVDTRCIRELGHQPSLHSFWVWWMGASHPRIPWGGCPSQIADPSPAQKQEKSHKFQSINSICSTRTQGMENVEDDSSWDS